MTGEPDVTAPSLAREQWALGLLTWGPVLGFVAFWAGVVAWVAGAVLLWSSPVWSTRERLMGTFLPPFGFLGTIVVVLRALASASSTGTLGFVLSLSVVAAVGAAPFVTMWRLLMTFESYRDSVRT